MHRSEKITSELLIIRHPDTYESINEATRQPMVSRLDVVPQADGGTQLAHFFEQANKHALELYRRYDPGYHQRNLRHIDKALSSPRTRAIVAWADVLLLVDGVTNNNRRFRTQEALTHWTNDRIAEKLKQEGLSSWTSKIEQVRTTKKPWGVCHTILTIEQEVRRELLSMSVGIQVDDRLRDLTGSKAHHAGMDRETYGRLVDGWPIKKEHWQDLYNFLNTAIALGEKQRALNRPMRVVAITHGKNVSILEKLIHSRGHEEDIAGKTYGHIKEELGTIPNGSGLQVFAYEDGTLEADRIYAPTNVVKQERIERGTQPSALTYLNATIIGKIWRD